MLRTDAKMWVFQDEKEEAKGERVYVFGYTWFEARRGALAALHSSSDGIQGREIENIADHLVEAGSTVVYVDRGSTWFEIIETLRRMSGIEVKNLRVFPSPFEDLPPLSGVELPPAQLTAEMMEELSSEEDNSPELQVLESELASHPSVEALKARLMTEVNNQEDWPEMAHIASQAIEALVVREKQKEEAYDERNRLVVLFASMALAAGWKAGVGEHEDEPGKAWDADWRMLVVVETPEGQASWHLHDSHRSLVKDLPLYAVKWDGHDTPTKYERLERLSQFFARIWPQVNLLKSLHEAMVPSGGRDKVPPIEGQDMTRNPTVEEELVRARSERNHYRDKYLNDDRIPIADTTIAKLEAERDALRERLRMALDREVEAIKQIARLQV